MSRRGYDRRRKCAEADCREWSITNYELKRDYADAVRREQGQPPWKSLRHAKPEQVLSMSNLEINHVTAPSRQEKYGRFWGSSGFVYGPGFKVWAEDFPAGTQLQIIVRVVLPPGAEPVANESDNAKPTPPPALPPWHTNDIQDLDA